MKNTCGTFYNKCQVVYFCDNSKELVEYILEDPSIHSTRSFLEIGPGSGAISLSLLKKLPHVRTI